ncbi:MAG: hypothetical protein ACE5KH_03660 [Candidatus Geothermarchaeales archaeon]
MTGSLCSSCESRLSEGSISRLDVDISVHLGRETKSDNELDRVRFMYALYVDDYIILFFKRGDLAAFLAHGKDILRGIKKKFRANVLAVEYHPNLRQFLEGIFYPTPVTALNVIWLPDGTRETRVILGRRAHHKKVGIATKIAKKVRNVDVKVEYFS